ncbi:N-acyl homoserine lactonase family protein [Agrobacterium vitis]
MRLYLLHLGLMQPGDVPVPGYLIQTPDGINILIDTGWPRSFVEDPRNPPGLVVEIRPEDTVVARLAAIGLQPSDIDYLICTHLDDDHSGNHDLFTSAECVVQRQQYELAKGEHPRFAANRAAWDHTSLHYRLIEGDIELVPDVELLETSGHVPGHQSVMVRLPQTGTVLLAADAVMHHSMADGATQLVDNVAAIVAEDQEAEILLTLNFPAVGRRLLRDGNQRCTTCIQVAKSVFEGSKIKVAIRASDPLIEGHHQRVVREKVPG